jgi:holo-[acyl-carrier protein] synthase
MIRGIGTDVCSIPRIQAALNRHGDRFALRVLGPQELQVWRHRSAKHAQRGISYLATRFSAKEAFSKAIGLGMHMPMAWSRCEILNRDSGEPYIFLHGDLKAWFEGQGWRAHVSVSDEVDTAVSFVVVESV